MELGSVQVILERAIRMVDNLQHYLKLGRHLLVQSFSYINNTSIKAM